MSPATKLALRASEIREKLAELAGTEELTDEQRTEIKTLRTEMRDVETKYQAAAEAEDESIKTETKEADPGDDGDPRLAELREKVNIGNYVAAALETRAVDGAESEYNSELGLKHGGAFPLQLLAPATMPERRGEKETRTTTDTNSQTNQNMWLDRLFADSAAMRLGVTFESAGPGLSSYLTTTAGASAAQRGRTQSAADAAWSIDVTELRPTRNAVRLVYSEEDALRLPGLPEALRRDLNMALIEGVDRAIFLGDAGANEDTADITGLNTAMIGETTLTQAAKVKGPDTLMAFAEMVDGIAAADFGDLNCILTTGCWRLWQSTIINAAADNMTLAAFLRQAGLMFSHRGELESNTADGDFAAFVGRRRGIEGAAVVPVWSAGSTLIRDPYTKAASGEVALTLAHYWNFGLPRTSNFRRLKFVQ